MSLLLQIKLVENEITPPLVAVVNGE